MNEKVSSPQWNDQWIELQRQYWDAWSRLSHETLGSASNKPGLSSPWADALENWWKAMSATTPEAGHEFMERIVQQGKAYMHMSEEFTRFINSAAESGQAAGQWQELLQSRFSHLKSLLTQTDPAGVAEALRGMLPFFELPIDTWTRTLSGASLFPGDFLETWKPQGMDYARDQLHDRIGRFLSVPGVGYTREWQEQAQHMGRMVLDYDKAMQEYLRIHGKLGTDTLERLSRKIMELAEKGEEIKSLRQIYDLWVDCGEEAYNELVFTDEYSEVYGHLVNSLMALKHHSQGVMDEAAGALNLPTRKGMTTLLRRQQELRREIVAIRSHLDKVETTETGNQLKALQDELRANQAGLQKVSALLSEVAALREELAALKASAHADKPSTPIIDKSAESAAPKRNTRKAAGTKKVVMQTQEKGA
jgi:class III poly(R)-hydroxyalkanoic acid synthase PhaE subunit